MTDPNAHDDLPPPAPPDEPVGCITVFGTVGLSLVIVVVDVTVCGVVASWLRTVGASGAGQAWCFAPISLLELIAVIVALRPINPKMSRDAIALRVGIAAGCAIAAGLNTACWRVYG